MRLLLALLAGFLIVSPMNVALAVTAPAATDSPIAEQLADSTAVAPELEGYGGEYWLSNLDVFSKSQPGDDFQQSVRRGINLAVLVVSFVAIAVLLVAGAQIIFGSQDAGGHKHAVTVVKYVATGLALLIASYTIVSWTITVLRVGGSQGTGDEGRTPHDPQDSCIPGSVGDWFCEQKYGDAWSCGSNWQCKFNLQKGLPTQVQVPPKQYDIERLACDASNSVNGIFGDQLCQSTLVRPTKGNANQFCSAVKTNVGGAWTCQDKSCSTDADCAFLNATSRPKVSNQTWGCNGAPGLCTAGPIARAGLDQSATRDLLVTLVGSGSTDPSKGTLSYVWTLQSSSDPSVVSLNTLTGTTNTTATYRFVAPSVPTVLVVKLVVTSSVTNLTSTDTVTVVVK